MATDLTVTSTITIGGVAKSTVWTNVDQKQLAKMERNVVNVLSKLSDVGTDVAHGKVVPPAATGTPITLEYDFRIEKADGSLYSDAHLTYPNLQPADVAWMQGLFNGEMKEHLAKGKAKAGR